MAYQEAQGRAEQSVWVGTIEDLKILVGQVEELAKYVHEKRVAAANAEKNARREAYMNHRAYQLSERQQLAEFEVEERLYYDKFARDTTLQMTIKYKRWDFTDTGTPAELFEKPIDVKDVKSINISLAGSSYATLDGYSLSVSLGENGATASIKAPEKQFIDLAATQLRGDFKRQRPWYWWFREPAAVYPTLIPALVASPFVFTAFAATALSILIGLVLLVLFACASMATTVVVMRLLARPFELVKEGAKSRSARQLGIIGSVVVWVLGTILFPVWLGSASTADPSPQPTRSMSEDL